MKNLTEIYIEKSQRTGRYADTAENRRLHRVGQPYKKRESLNLKENDIKVKHSYGKNLGVNNEIHKVGNLIELQIGQIGKISGYGNTKDGGNNTLRGGNGGGGGNDGGGGNGDDGDKFGNVKDRRDFLIKSLYFNTLDKFVGDIPTTALSDGGDISSDYGKQKDTINNIFEKIDDNQIYNAVLSIMNATACFHSSVRKYLNSKLRDKNLAPIADSLTMNKIGDTTFKVYERFSSGGIYDAEFNKFLNGIKFSYNRGVEMFTSEIHSKVRDYLIGRTHDSDGDVIKIIDSLDSLYENNNCPDNLALERVLHVKEDYPNDLNYLMNINVGETFTDDSFASFSIGTDSVGSECDFKITLLARKGDPVIHILGNKHDAENEFLANRGTSYKVLQKGFNSIVVEIVR